MSEIEQLIEEVGARDFRPLSEEYRQERENSDWREYDADEDTVMDLDQAKRLSDAAERPVSSTSFEDDEEFFEILHRIEEDWPCVEFYFSGCIGEHGYLDGVYVAHECSEDFRKYMTLHFKHWMEGGPEENEGICPLCDDRIEFSHETFRDDDALWAAPDEFGFREYPHFGECARMWWDD